MIAYFLIITNQMTEKCRLNIHVMKTIHAVLYKDKQECMIKNRPIHVYHKSISLNTEYCVNIYDVLGITNLPVYALIHKMICVMVSASPGFSYLYILYACSHFDMHIVIYKVNVGQYLCRLMISWSFIEINHKIH